MTGLNNRDSYYEMTDDEVAILHKIADSGDLEDRRHLLPEDQAIPSADEAGLQKWVNQNRFSSSDPILKLAIDVMITPEPSTRQKAFEFVRNSNFFTLNDRDRFSILALSGETWVDIEQIKRRLPASEAPRRFPVKNFVPPDL